MSPYYFHNVRVVLCNLTELFGYRCYSFMLYYTVLVEMTFKIVIIGVQRHSGNSTSTIYLAQNCIMRQRHDLPHRFTVYATNI